MQEILLIVLFNLILYFRTLRYSLCVDDIRRYKYVRKYAFKNRKWWPPLAFLENIKDRLYGGGTFGPFEEADHALTMFLHITASVLVYLAFHSFWAAVLYSCNPTNLQTSVWLNGRRYLINVILVLLMVMFPLAGVPLYLATGLFHVTAFFAPILFLGWWGFLACGLFYLAFRKWIHKNVKERMDRISTKDWKVWSWKRLIVVVKVYGFHFFKTVFPGITLMNYPTLFWWGVTKEGDKDAYAFNFDFICGTLAIICSIVLVACAPVEYRSYAMFMFLAIIQWSAIIPAQQLLADRYTSTAMPFMMFFVAMFLPWYACAALTGFYVARLWSAMDMFTTIGHYYRRQLHFAPHITTPRKDVINAYTHPENKNRDYFTAWHYIREGLKYTPNDFSMLISGAVCAKALGIRKMALEYIEKAEKHPYVDKEAEQIAACRAFKEQMKKEDLAQIHGKVK